MSARYFVLEGKLLSYYKQQTDALPRGALFLANVGLMAWSPLHCPVFRDCLPLP
jgi:hypothetical protein